MRKTFNSNSRVCWLLLLFAVPSANGFLSKIKRRLSSSSPLLAGRQPDNPLGWQAPVQDYAVVDPKPRPLLEQSDLRVPAYRARGDQDVRFGGFRRQPVLPEPPKVEEQDAVAEPPKAEEETVVTVTEPPKALVVESPKKEQADPVVLDETQQRRETNAEAIMEQMVGLEDWVTANVVQDLLGQPTVPETADNVIATTGPQDTTLKNGSPPAEEPLSTGDGSQEDTPNVVAMSDPVVVEDAPKEKAIMGSGNVVINRAPRFFEPPRQANIAGYGTGELAESPKLEEPVVEPPPVRDEQEQRQQTSVEAIMEQMIGLEDWVTADVVQDVLGTSVTATISNTEATDAEETQDTSLNLDSATEEPLSKANGPQEDATRVVINSDVVVVEDPPKEEAPDILGNGNVVINRRPRFVEPPRMGGYGLGELAQKEPTTEMATDEVNLPAEEPTITGSSPPEHTPEAVAGSGLLVEDPPKEEDVGVLEETTIEEEAIGEATEVAVEEDPVTVEGSGNTENKVVSGRLFLEEELVQATDKPERVVDTAEITHDDVKTDETKAEPVSEAKPFSFFFAKKMAVTTSEEIGEGSKETESPQLEKQLDVANEMAESGADVNESYNQVALIQAMTEATPDTKYDADLKEDPSDIEEETLTVGISKDEETVSKESEEHVQMDEETAELAGVVEDIVESENSVELVEAMMEATPDTKSDADLKVEEGPSDIEEATPTVDIAKGEATTANESEERVQMDEETAELAEDVEDVVDMDSENSVELVETMTEATPDADLKEEDPSDIQEVTPLVDMSKDEETTAMESEEHVQMDEEAAEAVAHSPLEADYALDFGNEETIEKGKVLELAETSTHSPPTTDGAEEDALVNADQQEDSLVVGLASMETLVENEETVALRNSASDDKDNTAQGWAECSIDIPDVNASAEVENEVGRFSEEEASAQPEGTVAEEMDIEAEATQEEAEQASPEIPEDVDIHTSEEEETATREHRMDTENLVDEAPEEEEESVELVEAMAEAAAEGEAKAEDAGVSVTELGTTSSNRQQTQARDPLLSKEEVLAAIDANQEAAIQRLTQRVQRMCPNMDPDVFPLIFQMQSKDLGVAKAALCQLSILLGKEKPGDETTLALYHACGHIFVLDTLMKTSYQDMQQAAMLVVWKLSSRHRAAAVNFNEIETFKRSLVCLGAADCAFAAIQGYSEDITLATFALSVVNNLIDTYTPDELFDMGVLAGTLAAMKEYPTDTSVQFVACDIFYRAAKAQGVASKLETIHAVSALSDVAERYNGVNERLHEKAQHVLSMVEEGALV